MTEETKPEYMRITDVAKLVGLKRSSMYYYLTGLNIEVHKFKFDKNGYIAMADVERIKQIKEKPWLAGPAHSKSKTGADAA